MAELAVGESVEMKGSGKTPYIIKNCGGGGFSCTCPAWKNQSVDPALRTCKHIVKLRGEEAEAVRLAGAVDLPSRKVEDSDGDEGDLVLLAHPWDNATNVTGWWMSEKLDGVRAYWDGKRFLSRKRNLFLAPDWFVEGLPDVPLDGELWIGRKAFQRASGIARSQTKSDDWREMRFVIFDAPGHGGEFEARIRFVEDLVQRRQFQYVERVEHTQCRSIDHLRQELERVNGLGGEGLMLRQPGSKYEVGRSHSLLKVKTFLDAEAVIVGHEAGQGRHKGRLGAFRVRMNNGVEFSVGTGLSDADRNNPLPIGTMITFRYQELSNTKVPRFPSFVGVRKDGEMSQLPQAPPVKLPSSEGPTTIVVPVAPPVTPAKPRRFHYGSGSDARFWEAVQAGTRLKLTFGKLDAPRTKEEAYASESEAGAALAALIADKIDDGFLESDTPAAPAPAPVLAKPAAEPVAVAPPPPPKPAPPPKAPPAPKAEAAPAPAPPAGGVRRFEYVEGTSAKFWEVWVDGNQCVTRWGKLGTTGQTKPKPFADTAAANKEANKLIAEKVGKGYTEVK